MKQAFRGKGAHLIWGRLKKEIAKKKKKDHLLRTGGYAEMPSGKEGDGRGGSLGKWSPQTKEKKRRLLKKGEDL